MLTRGLVHKLLIVCLRGCVTATMPRPKVFTLSTLPAVYSVPIRTRHGSFKRIQDSEKLGSESSTGTCLPNSWRRGLCRLGLACAYATRTIQQTLESISSATQSDELGISIRDAINVIAGWTCCDAGHAGGPRRGTRLLPKVSRPISHVDRQKLQAIGGASYVSKQRTSPPRNGFSSHKHQTVNKHQVTK